MDALEIMDKKQIREFLCKGWITHDAMWLTQCMRELGEETANRLNIGAVRRMALIEMKRIRELMGKSCVPITGSDQLKDTVDFAFSLIKPDFMEFTYSFPEPGLLWVIFRKCFAYEGMLKTGFAGQYRCAVLERLKSWFDYMGVKYEMSPVFSGCLMRDRGRCSVEFRFFFQDRDG